jgi:hypothetical protein
MTTVGIVRTSETISVDRKVLNRIQAPNRQIDESSANNDIPDLVQQSLKAIGDQTIKLYGKEELKRRGQFMLNQLIDESSI